MSLLPPDAAARAQALDPSQSFLCEAPAGSGKTELLTQRFLKLLSRVQSPEEILAITFTRKATGEMRERVMSAIQLAQHSPPEAPHKQDTWQLAKDVLNTDKRYGWKLLESPNRLQIKTFDSLCASLTRAMPFESSFGAQPQVEEDPEKIYKQAVRTLFDSLEDDWPWVDGLVELLELLDNKFERLESLLIDLLYRREEWLPLMGYQGESSHIRETLELHFRNVIAETVDQLKNLIPFPLHEDIIDLAGFAAANLQRDGRVSRILACVDIDLGSKNLPGKSPEDIEKWLGIAEMLTTFKGTWRISLTKRIGFPSGENYEERVAFSAQKKQLQSVLEKLQGIPGLDDAFQNLRRLPRPDFDDSQWKILNALFEVLPILAAQLTLQFKEKNRVDFSEISIAARRALGDLDSPTDLALRMDYRIQHILVDEFQDTSATQVELIEQLTMGWQPDDGRTLFCVGDAMQSIYGFRGANVGLFLHCRDNGLANVSLSPLRLTANFRSQEGVVDWVNRVFEPSFPQKNNISTGAVRYSPSEAVHEKLRGKPVYVHGFVDRKNNYDEARVVLGIVRKSWIDKPDATIAILVRSRDHASHILPLLREAGIKYRAVDLEPLESHAVIQDLLALTRALMHLADRTAWLSVLRAPWCGLSLVDLEAISSVRLDSSEELPSVFEQCKKILEFNVSDLNVRSEQHQNDFFLAEDIGDSDVHIKSLSDDGLARLRRVFPVLTLAVENRDRKYFRSWLEGTWVQLGGPACLENETALKNAGVFFKFLEKWPYATDLPGISYLETAVKGLYGASDPEADEKLQIMTIHKSKGLEFDVVIIPALHRSTRANDNRLLMWNERLNSSGQRELLMAPLTLTAKGKHPTYLHLRSEETKKNDYENGRLLYVACTRAKAQLHLLAHVRQDPRDTLRLRAPARSSLLATVWDALQVRIRRYENGENQKESEAFQETSMHRPLHRLKSRWRMPDLPQGEMLSAYVADHQFDNSDNSIDISWLDPSAKQIGTAVHRFIQLIGNSGFEHWDQERLLHSRPQIKTLLANLGVGKEKLEFALDKCSQALKNLIHNPYTKVLFDRECTFSKNEYALTLNRKSGLINLVIDRVFTNQAGETWVVDYKTSEPGEDESLEEFLKSETECYQDKMRLYQSALGLKGFSNIHAALFFPLIGEIVTLT